MRNKDAEELEESSRMTPEEITEGLLRRFQNCKPISVNIGKAIDGQQMIESLMAMRLCWKIHTAGVSPAVVSVLKDVVDKIWETNSVSSKTTNDKAR